MAPNILILKKEVYEFSKIMQDPWTFNIVYLRLSYEFVKVFANVVETRRVVSSVVEGKKSLSSSKYISP